MVTETNQSLCRVTPEIVQLMTQEKTNSYEEEVFKVYQGTRYEVSDGERDLVFSMKIREFSDPKDKNEAFEEKESSF